MKNNNQVLLSEVKMTYAVKQRPTFKITSSNDAFTYVKEFYPSDMDMKEFFYVLYLNTMNKVIGHYKISEGGITGTVADVRLIFSGALKCLATAMVLIHNHPSNNMRASRQDIDLTNKIKSAGQVMEISVLDHLILGHNEINEMIYYSFADEGMM